MNVFFESPANRLKMWKEFRKSVTGLSDMEIMERTMSWWEQAPVVKCAWDWTKAVQEWPTPWEFLSDGYFCGNSLSLLIAHTLLRCGFDRDRLALKIIRDDDMSHQGVMLIVDGTWVIGHTRGVVVRLDSFRHTVMEDLELPEAL